MTPAGTETNGDAPKAQWFPTTHWTIVLGATGRSAESRAALEQLCQTYWYPLYAYARRQGKSVEDAEDLVQGFFLRLLGKEVLKGLERDLGRFRSFLLTCFNHYLADEQDRARCLKRGGDREIVSLDGGLAEERYGYEPVERYDPERLFERRWALTVLETVLARLKEELEAAGKGRLFEHLQSAVVGDSSDSRQSELASRLGLSKGAVAVTVHRLRQRYRRLLWEEVAHTVQRVEEVDDEMRHLLATLRG